jgi:hypothetical protein
MSRNNARKLPRYILINAARDVSRMLKDVVILDRIEKGQFKAFTS